MQSRELNNNEVNITYTDFSPDSWFLMTVRNKTTGEIYLTDGFDPAKGYPAYLDGTMKARNRDDLLVEFSGNPITVTAWIYVKPFGNFEDTKNLTFTECKYFDVPWEYTTGRTAVPITTGTTRPPTVTRTPSLIGYSHNTTGHPPG